MRSESATTPLNPARNSGPRSERTATANSGNNCSASSGCSLTRATTWPTTPGLCRPPRWMFKSTDAHNMRTVSKSAPAMRCVSSATSGPLMSSYGDSSSRCQIIG